MTHNLVETIRFQWFFEAVTPDELFQLFRKSTVFVSIMCYVSVFDVVAVKPSQACWKPLFFNIVTISVSRYHNIENYQ